MKSIQLQQLTKSFGETEVIRGIDVTIEAGEFFALVGPSGCGKSTMLRMIAGLESITSGTLRIDGVAANGMKPSERHLSMVFQNYALYPHMTVEKNITFGLHTKGLTKLEQRERCLQAAETLGLTDYLKRKPRELSGGQRQRVALARAIVTEAPICLMDEPLSNLDAKLRAKMRSEIRQLQRKLGLTMIYVTHDQVEAMTMADRIMLLNEGEVQQVGKPLDLYNKPANTFVASFIGSPPMNLVDVTRQEKGWMASDGRIFHPNALTEVSQATLGVRPEQIKPADKDVTFYAELKNIEVLGTETILAFDVGGNEWLAKWPGQWPLTVGEKVACYVDSKQMSLFDTNGQRIEPRQPKLFEALEVFQ
ncbi:ABC transporter ATP-binding protein [Exiguobacterium sp. s155]|uniref:ABC transporter ATP-binding protein n=1 Tax=Exiguobacterium sp. s155 TaxID=2751286 RepID=UPI001BE64232|nr:ABC transporter ATP-binding protein [Exiguobacterium sp. s155]